MNSLVKVLEQQIEESESSSSEVSQQRERNYRYYSMQPLGNEQPGRSHYISPTVHDAVETKKSIFSEAFLSARDVVKFSNCTTQYEAESKTSYVNRQLRRNNYERLFTDGWHNAFVAKRMVTLTEWQPDSKTATMQLSGTPAPVVQMQIQQMGNVLSVDDSQVHVQPVPSPQGVVGMVTGELNIELDDGYVKVTLCQPERFFRDPNATYPEDSSFCTYVEEIARGRLVEMGYEADQVDKLHDEWRHRNSEEDSARKRHDRSWSQHRKHNRVSEQREVDFIRTWTWLDAAEGHFDELNVEFEDGYKLYEIHWANGEVLRFEGEEDEEGNVTEGNHAIREAEEMPFDEWSEIKVSHAENGLCTSDVLAHQQKVESQLKRVVIDNQMQRNNPSYEVLLNALKRPADLVSGKVAKVHFTRTMGSVAPLNVPDLSPHVMGVMQMLRQDSEERSGMSSLGKGMNTDALKHQNASNMVERLTNAGTRRVTAQARDFANSFLIPLCQRIARIGMDNDKSVEQMEIAGQQVPVSPSAWKDDGMHMDTAVALTSDDGTKAAQQLLMMHAVMKDDPQMAISYGDSQRHALMDEVFDLMGITDTSRYMLSPNDQQYQQAQQQQSQVAQGEKLKQDKVFGMQLESGQAQIGLAKSADKREWQRFQWDQTDSMADNLLNDDKFEWQKDKDQQEIELERTQNRGVSVG